MRAEIDIRPVTGCECRSRPGDAEIAAICRHGLVARSELLALGLGRRAIDHRVARGRLHVVHRGVYAVGHRPRTREARWLAAVLAMGPGAVLSHRAAAALWGLRDDDRLEVTVPRDRRGVGGIIVHRSLLPPDEVTEHRGISVTSVVRTAIDLAEVRPRYEVSKAINEAEHQRLLDTLSLADVVERYPGKRGIAKVRAILAEARIGVDVTRSEFEAAFLRFVARHGLPRPEVNAPVETATRTYECDTVWREQRVIVELDGFAAHGTRLRFESDRARDRALRVAGWQVIRVTWRQLKREGAALRADLRSLLLPPRSTSAPS